MFLANIEKIMTNLPPILTAIDFQLKKRYRSIVSDIAVLI